jgi:hypothetical protein
MKRYVVHTPMDAAQLWQEGTLCDPGLPLGSDSKILRTTFKFTAATDRLLSVLGPTGWSLAGSPGRFYVTPPLRIQ